MAGRSKRVSRTVASSIRDTRYVRNPLGVFATRYQVVPLLPVRQLAVGSAAINTLWRIGAFLSPYVWGVTRDATGSFRTALIGGSVVVVVEALVMLYVRTRVMSERRERAVANEQPLAVPS